MNKIIQLITVAAAAGTIVGCASERGQSNTTSAEQTAVNNSYYQPSSAGGADINAANGGIGSGGPATGNEGTGYQLNNPANQAAANVSRVSAEGTFSKAALRLDQLPEAAQTTIRNQVGSLPIASIESDTKDGQAAYKVKLEKRSAFSARPELIVSADGALLKESHLPTPMINEAAGAQNSQPATVTNGVSGVEEWRK